MAERRNSFISGDERVQSVGQSTICWPAIFSGLFVTMIVYVGLMSLGLAFGGRSLYDIVQNRDGLAGLGIGAALWTIVAAIVALFFGGHVSGRVAGMISTRVGRIQGLVIASLFFALMFTQMGLLMGALGGGISSAAITMGSSAMNTQIGQDVIEDAIGDLQLKSPLPQVVQGVGSRLLRGDEDSAVSYLAHQAGLSQAEARARLDQFKARFNEAMTQAALAMAKTLRSAGWTLTLAILFGSLAGMAGGAFGANYNLREPLSMADDRALRESPAT